MSSENLRRAPRASSTDSEIEFIAIRHPLKLTICIVIFLDVCPASKSGLPRLIILQYTKPPRTIELPWPEEAEYVTLLDHMAAINIVMDARPMSIVKQFAGRLSDDMARRLCEGTASPALFTDSEDWGSPILLRDVMIMERPSTGCVVFATPSVLSHRLAEQQQRATETASDANTSASFTSHRTASAKGKRKASRSPSSVRQAKTRHDSH